MPLAYHISELVGNFFFATIDISVNYNHIKTEDDSKVIALKKDEFF
jgi:hypothetical protein